MQQRIVLIGLSGSGKTSVGPLIAQALGWNFVDTDHMIEQEAGRTIAEIFVQGGEAMFRALERRALTRVLSGSQVVVATGGGMVEDAVNRGRIQRSAFCVWLQAPITTLLERLAAANDRPLLSDDPEATLTAMAERRMPLYASIADWIAVTSALSPQQIADTIVQAYRLHENPASSGQPAAHANVAAQPHENPIVVAPVQVSADAHADVRETQDKPATLHEKSPSGRGLQVTTPGGAYEVRIGLGAWNELPERLDRLGLHGRVWIVSNTHVLPRYRDRLLDLLRPGREVQTFAMHAGEQHKTLITVQKIYDWLLHNGVERRDTLLAVGGGVVGDLAGFVAATVLRGIAFVQLPTTVLAMVDSSIGGKTGVDHAVGKNLIGAFYQPRLVLGDTSVLATLPRSERRAGWAEAIKHGVIGDAEFLDDLKRNADEVLALHEPVTSRLLQRAADFKVGVVSADEREHAGRIALNYGHTLGHALEAESRYSLPHGEAVAIGMMAAGSIAVRLGLFSPDDLELQRQTIAAFNLPTRIPPGINGPRALKRIASDKKVLAQRVRWVLPTGIGATTVRDDVPIPLVEDIVRSLAR